MGVLYYFLVLAVGLVVGALLRNEAVKNARSIATEAHALRQDAYQAEAKAKAELHKLRLAIANKAKLKK